MHFHGVLGFGSRQFRNGVVVGKAQPERLLGTRREPLKLIVQPRWIRGRADLDWHALMAALLTGGAVLAEALALEIDDRGVAVANHAVFDRLEPRRALAQLIQRLIHAGVVDRRRTAPRLDGREIARIEGGEDVELRLEGQRLTLFDVDVADVRRIDRLDVAFAERFARPRVSTSSWATSCRIWCLKRWRTTLAGTLPGRKPGILAALP